MINEEDKGNYRKIQCPFCESGLKYIHNRALEKKLCEIKKSSDVNFQDPFIFIGLCDECGEKFVVIDTMNINSIQHVKPFTETHFKDASTIKLIYEARAIHKWIHCYIDIISPASFSSFSLPTLTYFIQPIEGGLIKIGSSKNPYQRLKTLQSHSPVPLEIILMVDEPEVDLHHRFTQYQDHNEWYKPSEEILQYIIDCLKEQCNRRENMIFNIKPMQKEEIGLELLTSEDDSEIFDLEEPPL